MRINGRRCWKMSSKKSICINLKQSGLCVAFIIGGKPSTQNMSIKNGAQPLMRMVMDPCMKMIINACWKVMDLWLLWQNPIL